MTYIMSNNPPVWQMVKDAIERFDGEATLSDLRNYIKNTYSDVKDNTIRCHITLCSVNAPARVHWGVNKKPRVARDSRYDLLFNAGGRRVERYDPEKHGIWEIRPDENGKLVVAKQERDPAFANTNGHAAYGNEDTIASPFESQLGQFLAHHIETVNINGKHLKLYIDQDDIEGVDYPTPVGPIGILATDENDNFVIFQLRMSQGTDQAVGQLLSQINWVRKHMAEGKTVRGVIVTSSASDKLKSTLSCLLGVSLFEYDVLFQVRPVSVK